MKDFKNVDEILKGVKETLSPSRASYNLQRGLTLFVKKLEKKYSSFVLLGCAPKKIIRRTDTFTGVVYENDLEFLSVGSYISFIIDDVYYYYQFDNYNTLFEDYFAAVKIKDGKIPEYYLRPNANDGHFYKNCETYTNEKSEEYFENIANEFLKAFEKEKYFLTTYKSKIEKRPKEIEQRFYY